MVRGIEIHHSKASRQLCSCCKSGGRWEEKGEPRGRSVTVVWLIIMPEFIIQAPWYQQSSLIWSPHC